MLKKEVNKINAQLKYFILGMFIVLISPSLGYFLVNSIYTYTNLSSEYNTLLEGFIISIRCIGLLIFAIGVLDFIEKRRKP